MECRSASKASGKHNEPIVRNHNVPIVGIHNGPIVEIQNVTKASVTHNANEMIGVLGHDSAFVMAILDQGQPGLMRGTL